MSPRESARCYDTQGGGGQTCKGMARLQLLPTSLEEHGVTYNQAQAARRNVHKVNTLIHTYSDANVHNSHTLINNARRAAS
jgi:hypothetical protein